MPWHIPKTWKPGDVKLTAAVLNYELRDELLYLYDTLATAATDLSDVIADIAALESDVAALQTPEAWTAVSTFVNSWDDQGGTDEPPAGFYKHIERVYLRGVIVGGINGSKAFDLPAGYRPAYKHQFLCRTDINNGSATVTVEPDGDVFCVDTANVGWVDLSPISFRVS